MYWELEADAVVVDCDQVNQKWSHLFEQVFVLLRWTLCMFQAACSSVGSITVYASSGVLLSSLE